MKVYVVTVESVEIYDDINDIIGIYSTYEKARKAVDDYRKSWEDVEVFECEYSGESYTAIETDVHVYTIKCMNLDNEMGE